LQEESGNLRRYKVSKYSKLAKALLKCELFEGFDDFQLTAMLECFSPKLYSFKKGDFIVMAGEPYYGLGIMVEGSAVVSKDNAAGNRVMMGVLSAGELFGEVIAFSGKEQWPANVQAQTDCNVIYIENNSIINQCGQACDFHCQLIKNLLKIVSNRAIMLNRRVEYLSMKSINSKVAYFLLEHMEKSGSNTFRLPMNRNEMADFLNISRPSMSREMGVMRDNGIIEFQKEAIRILKPDKLREMIGQ